MNQLCKVCSERAAGFHFGAFTCEGCKVGQAAFKECGHMERGTELHRCFLTGCVSDVDLPLSFTSGPDLPPVLILSFVASQFT
ncbi:hypothetical protein J6590_013215 [Homalodisca vitripennis]|nr:hypothetical protein J6590_013215 [Homalodisca vitripennis]